MTLSVGLTGDSALDLDGVRPRKEQIQRLRIPDIDVGELLEEIIQVHQRIETVLLGRFDETVDRGARFRPASRGREQPVFSSLCGAHRYAAPGYRYRSI